MAGMLAAGAAGLMVSIPDFIALGNKTPTYGDSIQTNYEGSGQDIKGMQQQMLNKGSGGQMSILLSSVSLFSLCSICVVFILAAVGMSSG